MRSIHTLIWLASFWTTAAAAVGTPLTYQGTLEDAGAPANGLYDFQFQLKTSAGSAVGAALSVDDVAVVGGVFTVQLDFGAGAFSGSDRKLGISVRPGASVGAFTALLPDAAVNAAPYAQYSNNAALSDSALDVANGSIDEIDIATGAVSARTIATSAVGNSEIDFDAVTSSKIATDAVGTSEISTDAVGSSEIAAGAVGNAELASNSVGVSKLIGANYVSPTNLNATIGANSCGTFDIGVTGGFEPGDFVVLNTTTTFPANVMVQPLEVVSTNLVKVRFCNNGTSSATLSNEGIRMMSVR